MSQDVTRLFRQFQPEHYQLELTPNADTMTFTGIVTISGKKVGRPSQRLTFHQNGLKISKANVVRHDKQDQTVAIDRLNAHKSYDEVRLHSQSMMYPGKYTVTLEFSGTITRPMNGLYPCFFEHKGQSKQLLATQFESHHAREVFPCIDEPEAKATFDLKLTTPKGLTVLSNTPVAKHITKGSLTTTQFETTPKMSVYLLAFIIGELEYQEATTKDGVLVRTYATPDNAKFTSFALDAAVRCLEFYNDYFAIGYPLKKCDLIALPDFASGAMENWGCITFREQTMLVDPKNTSLMLKQYVSMVVAHELAHMWFGNLVTMRWWTDLWLNEGFASWVEYLAVDHLFPDWQMWTQFVTDEQQTALRLDALENTHPVEVPVRHPDEIRSIFDTISYNKGASVIHMLHEYLGPEAFRDGLRHYLKKFAYKNTDTVDLWDSLAEVAKKPVQSFMHAWTSLPGFPIVSVTVDGGSLDAKQARFYANPKQTKDTQTVWPVPLNAQLKPDLFKQSNQQWKLPPNKQTLKLNSGQGGYYRTIYDAQQVAALGKAIKAGQLEPLDRLGILSDMFEAAKAGYIETQQALELLANFANEDNNAVWDVMASGITSIRAVMDNDELRDLLKPFMRQLAAKQLKRLGWQAKPNEPHFDSLLRPTILGMAALAEEPSVVNEALKLFKNMKRPEDLPTDLRGVIYNTAARHGNEATFAKLLTLHNSSASSEERTTLTSALTGFEQPALIKKALAQISSSDVRLQDASYWIAYSFMNRHAKKLTWGWLTEHWQWLDKNLGADLAFPRMPLYVARSFSDPAFLKEYKAFFSKVLTPVMERTYKQGIEMITWQAAWKQRDLEQIKLFFKATSNNS